MIEKRQYNPKNENGKLVSASEQIQNEESSTSKVNFLNNLDQIYKDLDRSKVFGEKQGFTQLVNELTSKENLYSSVYFQGSFDGGSAAYAYVPKYIKYMDNPDENPILGRPETLRVPYIDDLGKFRSMGLVVNPENPKDWILHLADNIITGFGQKSNVISYSSGVFKTEREEGKVSLGDMLNNISKEISSTSLNSHFTNLINSEGSVNLEVFKQFSNFMDQASAEQDDVRKQIRDPWDQVTSIKERIGRLVDGKGLLVEDCFNKLHQITQDFKGKFNDDSCKITIDYLTYLIEDKYNQNLNKCTSAHNDQYLKTELTQLLTPENHLVEDYTNKLNLIISLFKDKTDENVSETAKKYLNTSVDKHHKKQSESLNENYMTKLSQSKEDGRNFFKRNANNLGLGFLAIALTSALAFVVPLLGILSLALTVGLTLKIANDESKFAEKNRLAREQQAKIKHEFKVKNSSLNTDLENTKKLISEFQYTQPAEPEKTHSISQEIETINSNFEGKKQELQTAFKNTQEELLTMKNKLVVADNEVIIQPSNTGQEALNKEVIKKKSLSKEALLDVREPEPEPEPEPKNSLT